MNIFRDKVAIITGAGSGIGKALSEELARRGASVVISDLNSGSLEDVKKGIEASGGKVTALPVDVTDYDSVKKMVDDTLASQGRLDYIFNNAGILVAGEAKDVSIDDWNAVLDVNLHGVVNGVAAAYPVMAEQGFGHIVNTSSLEGLVPFHMSASYVATKYAVVGMSNSLRIEGAQLGVRVSVVCPGVIKTPLLDNLKLVKTSKDIYFHGLPDWICITPEECAKTILKGVSKNKAFIVVTAFAKMLWWLHRINPNITLWMQRKMLKQQREEGGKSKD